MSAPARTSADLVQAAQAALFPNYRQFPVVFARGRGTRLWDVQGREYVDFVAGIATCNLGHCHPAVTRALKAQAGTLVHVSNWYYTEPQILLAERLCGLASLERAFFCNSGAEAAEAAIKLARKRSFEKHGPGRNTVVSLFGAFHGRTMKALTATDPKHHLEAFAPYPEGFVHIRPGDVEALARAIPTACAFFAEPIQGEGGVIEIDGAFLREAAGLCRAHDALLMIDEVQTGMGRCGALFGHQLCGIEPDVVTMAKGLGNGFPIGAVLARGEAAAFLGPGTHGSTFGGNPMACAAALATIETLVSRRLPERAARIGLTLRRGLGKLAKKHPVCVRVRGAGLLLGLELSAPAAPFVLRLMERGFLATAVQERTLRFTPALTISAGEIRGLLGALDEALAGNGAAS